LNQEGPASGQDSHVALRVRTELRNQLPHAGDVQVVNRGDADHIGPVLVDETQEVAGGRRRAEVKALPAAELEQIANHAHPDFVQLALGADADEYSASFRGAGDSGIEQRHDQLRHGCAVVLLSNADLIRFPEAPDLVLRFLQQASVDVLHRIFVGSPQHELDGRSPLGIAKEIHVLPRNG